MRNAKTIKRVLAGAAAAVMAVTTLAGCSDSSSSSKDDNSTTEQGKKLNIYCWNTEFQERFEKYYVPNADRSVFEGVEINWVQNTNENNVYQTKLDEALKSRTMLLPMTRSTFSSLKWTTLLSM